MFSNSIIAALIASMSIGAFAAPAFATVINSDINMSERDLRNMCERSGGAFTTYSDGTYGCITNDDNGDLVTASCDADGSCIGTRGKQSAVLSPRNASSATVALNLSEKLRLLAIRVSHHQSWIHLSSLSSFTGPLQSTVSDT